LGTNIEIASGIGHEDSVITNPGERLVPGMKVDIVAAATQPSTRP
jgi:hypothetical protein